MADRDPTSDLAAVRAALEVRDRAEAERWDEAAVDPQFRQEMRDVASDLRWAQTLSYEHW